MTATKVHHRTRGGGSGRTHRPRRRWVGRSSYRSSLAVRPQRPTAAGKAHSREPNGTAITDSDRKLRIFLRKEGAERRIFAARLLTDSGSGGVPIVCSVLASRPHESLLRLSA